MRGISYTEEEDKFILEFYGRTPIKDLTFLIRKVSENHRSILSIQGRYYKMMCEINKEYKKPIRYDKLNTGAVGLSAQDLIRAVTNSGETGKSAARIIKNFSGEPITHDMLVSMMKGRGLPRRYLNRRVRKFLGIL